MNGKTVKWTQIYTKAITLSTTIKNTTFCRRSRHNSLFIGYYTERSIHTQNNPQKSFWMDMLPEKSKPMEFLEQDPVRSKIAVDNSCLKKKKKSTEF